MPRADTDIRQLAPAPGWPWRNVEAEHQNVARDAAIVDGYSLIYPLVYAVKWYRETGRPADTWLRARIDETVETF